MRLTNSLYFDAAEWRVGVIETAVLRITELEEEGKGRQRRKGCPRIDFPSQGFSCNRRLPTTKTTHTHNNNKRKRERRRRREEEKKNLEPS